MIIIFWIENYHSLFIPVKFFHYFFIPVFPPFGIFIVLSFASKMVLGPWELPPGAFSRTLFVSFHFVSFLYCFGYFSFLCLENCPWKLSKGTCSRTLFAFFFVFFFILASFPPLPSKLTLEIVKRNFFSNPFRFFFFVLASFPPLPSKVTLEIVKGVFSRALFVFFSSCAFKTDFRNCQNDFFLEPLSFFFVFFSLQN